MSAENRAQVTEYIQSLYIHQIENSDLQMRWS
jgi:hypothetical protein